MLRKDVDRLDHDPHTQWWIHTVGFWFWTINFPLVAYLFFFQPRLWFKWGLFITLVYSVYANWSTDFGGMSAAESVIVSKKGPDVPDV